MEARIAAYQRENRDNIMENEARKVQSLLLCSLPSSAWIISAILPQYANRGIYLRQRRRGHGLTVQQGARRQENPVPLHQLQCSSMKNPPSTLQQLPCMLSLHAWPHDQCLAS